MEYSPLTWMSSAQSHLSLLDKVQGRVDRLIHGAGGQGQQKRERQQQRLNPHTHQDNSTQLLDSMEHQRRVGALTVLHRSKVQLTPHLMEVRIP